MTRIRGIILAVEVPFRYCGGQVRRCCSFRVLTATVRRVWGTRLAGQNAQQEFLRRVQAVAAKLAAKAAQAGHPHDFDEGQFYAAAALAIIAHSNLKNKLPGVHHHRKSGELYVFHMLRILERLLEDDVPYLGWRAYVAAWLHDTLEDTHLTEAQITQIFDARVANIVLALSHFRTSKYSTKFQDLERSDPHFIKNAQKYMEAVYLKLADIDDYFDTCAGLSAESRFLHFRMVNEVLYPLAVTVIGAKALALNVANKAFAMQTVPYQRCQDLLHKLDEQETARQVENIHRQIVDRLSQAGITAQISLTRRTPYELHLKKDRARAELHRLDLHFWRRATSLNPEAVFYAHVASPCPERQLRRQLRTATDTLRERRRQQISTIRLRDLFFIDVMVSTTADGRQARDILRSGFTILPERSRDFSETLKPNGYCGWHEELLISADRPDSARVRITSTEMVALNQLGWAVTTLSPAGLATCSSPLLSKDVLHVLTTGDREQRRRILRDLPEARRIKVVCPALDFSRPLWVRRQDTLLDILTSLQPKMALKFAQATWGSTTWGPQGLDPVEGFDWTNGQEIMVILQTAWSGYDLYGLLENPHNVQAVQNYVQKRVSDREKIALGRAMTMFVLGKSHYAIDADLPLPTLLSAITRRRTPLEIHWVREAVAEFYAGFNASEFFGQVAQRNIPLLEFVGALNHYYNSGYPLQPEDSCGTDLLES